MAAVRYYFTDNVLNIDCLELQRAGKPVKLQPQAFQVLAYLITHRQRVVPKSELFEQLWPERCVTDASLSSCIKVIRQALGDSGRAQRIIQTLHGYGYRFVAEVVEIDASSDEEAPPTSAITDVKPLAQTPQSAATTAPDLFAKEHKQVSVLCCALADMPVFAERLGEEALDQLMQAFFAVVQDVLQRYGGTVTQWLDSGFMALFGAPLSYEDHARRALLAALELEQRLEQGIADGAADGPTLSACIGLHTGAMIVASLDSEPQQPYAAAGETTRLAHYLQQQAPSGTLLISEAAYHLLQTEIRAEPWNTRLYRRRSEDQALPGAESKIKAYKVVGVTPRRTGVPRRNAHTLTPFVARERELAILHDRLSLVAEGQGQVVGIAGEPGIGKTRLLYEFHNDLNRKGMRYYQGGCLSYGSSTPYLPVLELFRQLCGINDKDHAEAITAKIVSCLKQAHLESAELVALLQQFVSLPTDHQTLAHLTLQARRQRTIKTLCQLVLHAHQDAPCVIALEDLHWIDASSEEWLVGLAAQLAGAAILLVATYRPGYKASWLEQSWATQLALPRLNRQAGIALVRSVPRAVIPSDELALDVVAKAEGNPFFLEELTWNLEADYAESLNIPDTVQAVLAARIDRLAPADKRLLQTSAVVGVQAPFTLLQALSDLSSTALEQGLLRLQAAEFLFETEVGLERSYHFKHALTQEVAYQSLLSRSKQQLHKKIACTLEEQFPASAATQPEILAHHYSEAGMSMEAIAYWQQAGRRAYEHSAHVEAISYINRGLAVLDDLADSEQRRRQELALQLTLGPVLMATKGYAAPEVEQTWTRARLLCEHTGKTSKKFQVLVGLWNFYWVSGQLQKALLTAQELLSLAEDQQDPGCLLRAHAALGEILFHTGQLPAARQHLAQGVELYHSLERHSHATESPSVACICYMAWVLWHLGYPDQARVHAEQALALARSLSHPFSLAIALSLTAELHQFYLETKTAEALSGEAIEVAREQEFPFWQGTAMVLRGWAWAVTGKPDEGIALLQQGISVFRSTRAEVQLSSWFGLLAEAYGNGERPEEGLRAVDEALRWVRTTGERYYEPELYRLRGQFFLQRGNAKQAEKDFLGGLQIARQHQARSWALRTVLDLAGLWQQQGRTEQAHKLLNEHYKEFTEGFDTPDLQRAKALLE